MRHQDLQLTAVDLHRVPRDAAWLAHDTDQQLRQQAARHQAQRQPAEQRVAEGTAALRLADSLIPSSDSDFEEAKKYLKKIRFLALGSATQDELATAKLIVGLK